MYVYCIEMSIYCTYILYRYVCLLILQSYIMKDDVVNPQTPRK